jgi:hypothetical protein
MRTFRVVRATVLAVLLLVPMGPTLANPLRDAIELRAAADSESARSQERIDELSDQTDALANEYRSILEQTDALQIYNEQLQKLLDSQEAEAHSLQLQIDGVALVGRQLTPLMLRMIDALERFVTLDVPFLLGERRARVNRLRELMSRADVTDSEKYRRILEAYQIENDYGRTIEAYQGFLEIGGEERTVDFLRVGRIAFLYQTLNGSEAGAWDASKGKWVELPGSYRVSIRRGLRMARKQAAPDLITLPVAAAEAAP